jgi:uncharacterized membrane protein YqgA involved in biofilm formation
MFLTGTLLNVVAVVIGATIGMLVGARMPARMRQSITDGLGLFTLVIGAALALQLFLDPAVTTGQQLGVLAGLLVGIIVGEALRLSDRLDALGAWAQRRLAGDDQQSRFSEGFVTSSLVFCVGPLTILGSIQNGLTGDFQLLAVKSLLDGVASVAFAAALGAGVYLSGGTVLLVQAPIATVAWLVGSGLDPVSIMAITSAGGMLLLGVGLRLLEIRQVRLVNFLPALLLAPIFVGLADAATAALAQ